MIISDLPMDEEVVFRVFRQLRHGGHDVILFHVLDEAEVNFPFHDLHEFIDPETQEKIEVNADQMRADYLQSITDFRARYRQESFQTGVDYVPLDTSMQFDRALISYLQSRSARG